MKTFQDFNRTLGDERIIRGCQWDACQEALKDLLDALYCEDSNSINTEFVKDQLDILCDNFYVKFNVNKPLKIERTKPKCRTEFFDFAANMARMNQGGV